MKRTAGLSIVMLIAVAGGWIYFSAKRSPNRHEGTAQVERVTHPETQTFSRPDNTLQLPKTSNKPIPNSTDPSDEPALPQTAQAQTAQVWATPFSQPSTGAAVPIRKPRGTPSMPVNSPQVSPSLPASGYSGARGTGGGPSTLSTGGNTASSDVVMQTTGGGETEIVIPAEASLPAALATGAAEANASSGAAASSDASALAADQIAEDFLNQVTPGGSDSSTSLEAWEDATNLADERYRSLKGHDAFLLYKLNAAKEALGSN